MLFLKWHQLVSQAVASLGRGVWIRSSKDHVGIAQPDEDLYEKLKEQLKEVVAALTQSGKGSSMKIFL